MTQDNNHRYKLISLTDFLADKMKLSLSTPIGADANLYDAVQSFANSSNHLIQLASNRGEVIDELVLMGEKENAVIHYSGAISKSTGKSIETIYLQYKKQMLSVTWGYPEDLGVIECLDIKKSIALEGLTRPSVAQGGNAIIVAHAAAPMPSHYRGIAQFHEEDIPRLQSTIEALLK